MVLSPQCFHNLNLHSDIFNHSNVHFWEYMQPGYDTLGFISCTGELLSTRVDDRSLITRRLTSSPARRLMVLYGIVCTCHLTATCISNLACLWVYVLTSCVPDVHRAMQRVTICWDDAHMGTAQRQGMHVLFDISQTRSAAYG